MADEIISRFFSASSFQELSESRFVPRRGTDFFLFFTDFFRRSIEFAKGGRWREMLVGSYEMNTCTASPPCISRFEISRGARDDPERMTYAHWTERRHGRFHGSPTNHAIECSNGTRMGEGEEDNRQNFLVFSFLPSPETLIGPNSKDQMLFRLFVNQEE